MSPPAPIRPATREQECFCETNPFSTASVASQALVEGAWTVAGCYAAGLLAPKTLPAGLGSAGAERAMLDVTR